MSTGTVEMRRKSDGFTLIETLVAVVIFAGVAITLQSAFSRGAQGIRVANHESRAIELGKAALTADAAADALKPGVNRSGASDGFVWDVTVSKYERADSDFIPASLQAYWVAVVVRWSDGEGTPERSLRLRTLKLGPAHDQN